MFTGRVAFNDFILSTFLVGSILWLGIALPLHIFASISWTSLFAFLPVLLTAYFLWNYLFYFKFNLTLTVFIWQAVLGLTALMPFTVHLDLLLTHYGEHPISSDSFDAILNTSYAATVLFVGGALGYLNAFLKSPSLDNPEKKVASWWTIDVDLNEHAYLSPPKFSRLNLLFIGFGAFAVILLTPLIFQSLSTESAKSIMMLLMRLCTMGITLIVYTVLAASVGEAIRLIQLQRRIGNGPFKIYDFDERLKWRHDYVKYHLPAPIRKLNLRLFNQHVEAYERLQKTNKASRN
jgi:hypothetical protein